MSSDQPPSAHVGRKSLIALGLPVWGSREDMWERVKNGAKHLALLQSLCRKRGLPTSGKIRDLEDRIFALFGKIMRKYFYGVLFCKYAKDGIRRRALTMHAMLERLPIQELRAKIYDEANVIHTEQSKKQSKEDMIEALWGAMPVVTLPVLLTPEQSCLANLRFLQQDPNNDVYYLYKHKKW